MESPIKIHPIFALTAIVLLSGIWYLSLLPKIDLPETHIFQADKLVHLSMYAILSLAIYKGFFNKKLVLAISFACFLSFFYGIVVEFAQELLTDTRKFDVFDIFANGLGTILAYLGVSKYLSV